MHVPDGFLDAPTSIGTGVVAAGAVALALRKAAPEIRESGPALPGLVAAFVFAAQMINFPVGAGTSGHLMGGALAAALVGPWTGMLCVSVVLLIQGVLFADGGLTALGTNIVLISIVTVLVGYGVMRAVLAVLPRGKPSVVAASALGAFVSVPVGALVFTGLYAVGGAVDIPIGKVAAAMVGWHVLIGIGEAVITAAVVSAVLAARPDIVFAARHLQRDLELVDADGTRRTVTADEARSRPAPAGRGLLLGFLAASVAVAGALSYFASAHPDGLESVAEELGFIDSATDSATAGSPVADYAVRGIGEGFLSGSLAGLIGVAATIAVGVLLAWLVRGRAARTDDAAAERVPNDPAATR